MGRLPVSLRVVLGAGACGLAGAMLAPAMLAAAPVTVKVNAGDFSPPVTEFNAFYPGNTTVRQGDKVTFAILGFHTVIFPKKGTQPAPFVIKGRPSTPANDPAGLPYWWGGQPGLTINPAIAAPSGGTVVTGARTVNSGFLQGNPAKFTVTFPKKGIYQVRCGVHPKMHGTVTVLAAGAAAPKQARVSRAAAAQKAADVKVAKANLRKARAPKQNNVVQIGPGNARVEALDFFPAAKTVAAGTAVTFKMAGVNEFHTVTFGPKAYVDQVEKTFNGPTDAPEGTLPSDPPGTAVSESPTTHGNGFLNSGVLFDPGHKNAPGAGSFTVTFPTAGVYSYRCLIHSQMRGSITVS